MIQLIRPTRTLESQALDFKQEFFSNNEKIINGSELLDQMDSYEEWLSSVTNNASPETVNPDWVVTDTFFAVNEAKKIVGHNHVEQVSL